MYVSTPNCILNVFHTQQGKFIQKCLQYTKLAIKNLCIACKKACYCCTIAGKLETIWSGDGWLAGTMGKKASDPQHRMQLRVSCTNPSYALCLWWIFTLLRRILYPATLLFIDLVELFRGLLAVTDQAPDKATIISLSKDYAIDL